MGYTHYWDVKRPIGKRAWDMICRDARQLFHATDIPLVGYEEEPASDPVVTRDMIRFNGVGDDEYESFVLVPDHDESPFCKTARKPYDLIVCAVLIVADHHAPFSIEVTSDGGMEGTVDDYAGPHDSEWDDALAFVHKVLGTQYKLPRLITHRRSDKPT